MGRLSLLAGLLLAAASVASAQTEEAAQRIAREVVPQVERAVGLSFRRPPAIRVRSRDQLRRYLDAKMEREFPPAELAGVERAYRAFALIPDTVGLRRLMLDLYSEQVVGFYDPDSTALFIVRGGDPMLLRVVMAHELVHALQDQYMSLNSILKLRRQNDRQTAGQAVAEGQAVVASLMALAPGVELPSLAQAWSAVREQVRQQQSAMPVFAGAPRFVQEGLLFPYLAGADFVRAFEERRARPDEQPYGDRMPVSTEQVLHASRYTAGERPLRVAIARTPGDTLVYDDDFGEFETRLALVAWGVEESDAVVAASGWNGDRYEVLGTRAGTVVVWASAWDTAQDAEEFERRLRRGWDRVARARSAAPSRRWQVDALDVGGVNVVRLVDAPAAWPGFSRLPAVIARR